MTFNISVIIPAFNVAPFIEKSVLSALEQDEVKEVMVVDDGSTDETALILEELSQKDSRVKVYYHEDKKNRGRAASRNLGLIKSSCDFIAFLDADDYYLEKRFNEDKRIFFANPDVDGVYNAIGAAFYREPGPGEMEKFSITSVKGTISPELLFSLMSPMGKKGHFSGDGLTLKRSVFNIVGYFNENLDVAEDTHMWLKLALKCRLAPGSLQKPVAMRGIHDKNVFDTYGKINYLKSYNQMWHSLLKWSLANNVTHQSIFNIWKKAIISDLDIRNKLFSKAIYFSRFTVLIFRNPKLITHKKLWRNFPIPYNIPELNYSSPLLNILTRTSGRPNGFKELRKSIGIQNYKNIKHLVSYDSKEDLDYLRNYDCETIKVIPVENKDADPHDYKPYNLYCNRLLEEVEEGWILILDDDNKLKDRKTLRILEKEISEIDEDTILFFQTSYPDGSKIPEEAYFSKKQIEKYHIDTACVVFHSKYKNKVQWDAWRTADYRFIYKLSQTIPKQRWIKKTLTHKFNFGDLGRRNDIY